jgi:hypothetical protein
LLAFFLRFVPKIGPFKALDFKIPTVQTENMYVTSVDKTVENYTELLHEAGEGDLKLTNTDFDTGRLAHAGEYPLTDKTYAHWLDQLAKRNFDQVTSEVRTNILDFYADLNAPVATKKKPKDWQKTMEELEKLKSLSITDKPNTKQTGEVDRFEDLLTPGNRALTPADTVNISQ